MEKASDEIREAVETKRLMEEAASLPESEQKTNVAADGYLENRRRKYIFAETSRLKPARLGDIRGMPHIVDDVKKFIAFLKDYRRFRERNVRVQPGIFLCGPPGTGKTLTARVIATESGAKLVDAGSFPRDGNSWKVSDVHSLFALAREYHARTERPVIIYFDEIDAVCPGTMMSRAEASTALMTELDGMGGKPKGVFVIAAANEYGVDGGILRAGRLGHHIHYDAPPYPRRAEILQYYIEKKPHQPINVDGLAKIMPSSITPADIEELVERAYMGVCLSSLDSELGESDLIRYLLEYVLHSPRGTWVTEAERYRGCVHEAGHVIVSVQLGCNPKLVVVPKSGYDKGITLLDAEEDGAPTPGQIASQVTVAYGGGAAEELVFGECHLGYTKDVMNATGLSVKLVAQLAKEQNYWDMEKYLSRDAKLLVPMGDAERSSIYAEARRIREESYRTAQRILREFGGEGIGRVARQISEREFLLGEDVERAVAEAKGAK